MLTEEAEGNKTRTTFLLRRTYSTCSSLILFLLSLFHRLLIDAATITQIFKESPDYSFESRLSSVEWSQETRLWLHALWRCDICAHVYFYHEENQITSSYAVFSQPLSVHPPPRWTFSIARCTGVAPCSSSSRSLLCRLTCVHALCHVKSGLMPPTCIIQSLSWHAARRSRRQWELTREAPSGRTGSRTAIRRRVSEPSGPRTKRSCTPDMWLLL